MEPYRMYYVCFLGVIEERAVQFGWKDQIIYCRFINSRHSRCLPRFVTSDTTLQIQYYQEKGEQQPTRSAEY